MADKKRKNKKPADKAKKNVGQSTTEQYKDTLFKDIFNNKQRFLELYNAISDNPYSDDANVEIYSNHALLAKYHDIAGAINNELVMMGEHQASINPNMPLRMLLYFTDVLRAFIVGENIYGSTKIDIPTPVFYVFYNGDTPYGTDVLELSDSYKIKGQRFTLEMKVKVININPGHNIPALAKSPWLNGYTQLTAKIKEYLESGNTRDKAIELAIDWCIANDIIKEYLQKNHGRVVKMLNYQITQEQYDAVIKRDGKMEMAKINKLYIKEKKTLDEIAKEMGMPVKEVKQALIDLGHDLD